ncbi:hypothetical protein NYO99_17135 [Pelomonas sp. UHG3]|jgi:hypothetical protein|uniref:Uncharacterized protein n=1 Tax=Roseateles hydrophilus TaxID=2975054 RepID=A0ACC6CEA0_9BURK|nr:hypothetical protein [Pelomonas sp. UHG3]MCY4746704.1 hypothetical protein [Pelomonas sp. UHG3]
MTTRKLPSTFVRISAISALLWFNLANAGTVQDADCLGDQSDRKNYDKAVGASNWAAIAERDAKRQRQVVSQLKTHRVRSARDFYCSSLILLHAGDEKSLQLSYSLAVQAKLHFPEERKFVRLSALAWDRLMMARRQPQWFSTQFEQNASKAGAFHLYPVAEGLMSESERVKLGGLSDAEVSAELKTLNAAPAATSQSPSASLVQDNAATRFELKIDAALLTTAVDADASLATFLALAKQTGFLAKTSDNGVLTGRRIFLPRTREALRPYFDGTVSTFPRPEGSATPVSGSGAEYKIEPAVDGVRRMTVGIDDNVQAAATMVVHPSRFFELTLLQDGPTELVVKSLGASPSR